VQWRTCDVSYDPQALHGTFVQHFKPLL